MEKIKVYTARDGQQIRVNTSKEDMEKEGFEFFPGDQVKIILLGNDYLCEGTVVGMAKGLGFMDLDKFFIWLNCADEECISYAEKNCIFKK